MTGSGRLEGRYWPTGRIERPTPREAWEHWKSETDPLRREVWAAIFARACERAS